MMKSICLIFVSAFTVFSSAAFALSPDDIVGTWKLISNVRQAAGSDKIENNLGEDPSGVLILTP
jgi:Lipocalin-like domain